MNIVSDLSEVTQLMATPFGLASLSVTFHVLGYMAFIFFSETMKYKPNSISWLMFAYGTTITAVLEKEVGAPLPLLMLPAICAIFSVWVAYRCLTNGNAELPKHPLDWLALATDITITVCYFLVSHMMERGMITPEIREHVVLGLLVAATSGSILPFIPQIRGMLDGSVTEHWLPWILWSLAYAFLAITTLSIHGLNGSLILYPLINLVLHILVFLLAVFLPRKPQLDTVQ
ncbi:MAG: hypothetical protein K2X81_19990 [Candidatus Obscuribacterales bacterium]|nr:hypothetical protein [Candidatus Obscuribacterales bacterium]